MRSSNIQSIGYEANSAILEVTFTSGHTYSYEAVPNEVHTQFLSAGSHGKFFHAHIRSRYRHQRIA